LIINNNSSDNTNNIISNQLKNEPNIRAFNEKNQGLSFARNRGYKESKGEYVAYIDDDCKAPPQWLSVAKEVIEKTSPSVFGGPYYPFYNTPKPKWFKDEYGSHVQDTKARLLREDEYLDGANIFFKRALLQEMGGFDPSLGMLGQKIGYGEETALLRSIRSCRPNEPIYYEPGLYVYHLVQRKKMKLLSIIPARFASGRYYYRIFYEKQKANNFKYSLVIREFILIILDFFIDIIKSIFRRDRKNYPLFQNYLFEQAFIKIERMGSLYEYCRQNRIRN
jgi:glucosyl-dolichyl phosphate glucuronosyltransferase